LLTSVILQKPSPFAPPPDVSHWGEEVDAIFNSAVLTKPDGNVLGIYDKRVLVPFGEYIPGESVLPALRAWMRVSQLTPGGPPRSLILGGHRMLVLICVEDIVPDLVWSDVKEINPDLLISIGSDAWFHGSQVGRVHLALARLRSVEHRRCLVRSTTTGVSAVVDRLTPHGQ
jgi:apolipoprotein N-acyltransferase